jgi:hypothetical protein
MHFASTLSGRLQRSICFLLVTQEWIRLCSRGVLCVCMWVVLNKLSKSCGAVPRWLPLPQWFMSFDEWSRRQAHSHDVLNPKSVSARPTHPTRTRRISVRSFCVLYMLSSEHYMWMPVILFGAECDFRTQKERERGRNAPTAKIRQQMDANEKREGAFNVLKGGCCH